MVVEETVVETEGAETEGAGSGEAETEAAGSGAVGSGAVDIVVATTEAAAWAEWAGSADWPLGHSNLHRN
jgi:hypothetical protein